MFYFYIGLLTFILYYTVECNLIYGIVGAYLLLNGYIHVWCVYYAFQAFVRGSPEIYQEDIDTYFKKGALSLSVNFV